MSHNVHHSSYKEHVNKKEVQAYWDNYAAREDWQEGCSGLLHDIRWIDKTFDSYDEALEFIEKEDKGWYDQIAVKYRRYPELKHSKTYEVLLERKDRLNAKYHEYADKIHYEGVKSSFITCRTCESKISTSYIGKEKRVGNRCPVCLGDLRPQSTLEIIANAKENAKKATADFNEEVKKLQAKQQKKAEIYWLVKVEYHT